jgi:hypothetical protein
MLILVDKEALRMVAAAGSRKWINLVAYCDFPNIAATIVDSQEARSWTTLDREQMATLYTNMSGQPAPEYSECIKQLSSYAETWPSYAKSEKALETEAEAIYQAEQSEKTEADFKAEAEQARQGQLNALQATVSAVEEMRKLPPGTYTLTGDAAAEMTRQAAAQAQKAAQKAPTEPQARPQQGATKKIWDIADDLLAANPTIGNIKEFRRTVIERAEAMGLNGGTAATQFGHWKRNKGL